MVLQDPVIYYTSERSFALAFDKGDEVIGTLTRFAREQELGGAHFTAIGAFSEVTLGYFDRERKDYRKIPVKEQVEVLSLIGDVAMDGDAPKTHAHVVVGKADGSTLGGHLLEGRVWPTLELVLTDLPRQMHRSIDRETGLALLHITDAS
jgi:predicted DNA-binding protein with PD1-like motif